MCVCAVFTLKVEEMCSIFFYIYCCLGSRYSTGVWWNSSVVVINNVNIKQIGLLFVCHSSFIIPITLCREAILTRQTSGVISALVCTFPFALLMSKSILTKQWIGRIFLFEVYFIDICTSIFVFVVVSKFRGLCHPDFFRCLLIQVTFRKIQIEPCSGWCFFFPSLCQELWRFVLIQY